MLISRPLLLAFLLPTDTFHLRLNAIYFFKLPLKDYQLKLFVEALGKYLLSAYFMPCIVLGTGEMTHQWKEIR